MITQTAQNPEFAKEQKREAELYQGDEYAKRLEEKNEVANFFRDYSIQINQGQREIIDKYWGTSSVKTPEELRRLFTN